MIRLGIIGTGLIWENAHEPVLREMPEFEIAALCVRRPERAEAYREKYPRARVYPEYHALLRDSGIDAVLVATPIPMNATVATEALVAGKDVFVEKPVAMSADEAQAVASIARREGRRIYVLEQYVYAAAVRRLQGILRETDLRQPIAYERISHYGMRTAGDGGIGYGTREWRHNPEFPLGALYDGGVHEIAVLTALFGIPERVFATGKRFLPDAEEPKFAYRGGCDYVLATYAYPGGMAGIHSSSACMENERDSFDIYFPNGSIHVEGGTIAVYRNGGRCERMEMPEENAHAVMWRELVGAHLENREPPFSVWDAIAGLRILDAIQRSLTTGMSVSLTTQSP